jgi:thiamine-monophosphate kinase
MTDGTPLGPGAEFDAIRQLLEQWGPRAVGIGDDAAVFSIPRGDSVVASVDAAVENRHFRRGWLTPREIGYRALAAAFSDLAAMAARPIGALVAIAVPDVWRADLVELANGIGDALDAVHAPVLGGNMSAGAELSITTTVIGAAFTPLRRRGARAGDSVYVTGRLGGPHAVLERLIAGEAAGEWRDRFARPVPRLAEARWLSERRATSAIDISDGLYADALHLAHASGVSIELDAALVPCLSGVTVESALASGEEYELVVTTPLAFDTFDFEQRFSLPLTRIGRVSAGSPGTVSVLGARVASARGHDHFSR